MGGRRPAIQVLIWSEPSSAILDSQARVPLCGTPLLERRSHPPLQDLPSIQRLLLQILLLKRLRHRVENLNDPLDGDLLSDRLRVFLLLAGAETDMMY